MRIERARCGMDDDVAISKLKTIICFEVTRHKDELIAEIYSVSGICFGSRELSLIEDALIEAIRQAELELLDDTCYSCSILRECEDIFTVYYQFTEFEVLND
ncbi:hypothetical protein DKL61_04570 [Gammaproteobacteria bacterium ESL0073]|nr:hypothetical protein DKL61_04570 [Gammaproteobacteria bacterium ESL0073]